MRSYIDEYKGIYEDVRIDQLTGKQILTSTENVASRDVARGGLLCDDPGLGKTITVLSLILQTCGLSTKSVMSEPTIVKKSDTQISGSSHHEKPEMSDIMIFRAYWKELTPSFREPALLKLLNELGKLNLTRLLFVNIRKLRKLAENDNSKFEDFCSDVENEILQSHNGPTSYAEAKAQLIRRFHGLVKDFTETQLRSAKKSFSSSKSKPKSIVAALVEQNSRKKLINTLIPSRGTLLVIPSVLMEHWQTQISMHVDLSYCVKANLKPLIFEYRKKNRSSNVQSLSVDEVTYLCQRRKTHAPVVFLDKAGTQPLPSPQFLSMFQLVITTTQRFMVEWKKGSFQSELARGKKGDDENVNKVYSESEACPLLKVHWLRLIVDEGHSMGNSHCNATIQFASWIQAERRWAMSGTPTKETDAQLGQILNLLKFLQHDFFVGRSDGTDWWKRSIVRSWKDGHAVSFFRIRSLLAFLMKRHSKIDIFELEPIYKNTFISMSSDEVTTYNTLVAGIQSNIVITSMKGKTSGEQDSLLHRSQAKNARLALKNVRLACVSWAHVIPTLTFNFYVETIRWAKTFEFNQDQITKISDYIHGAQNRNLSNCDCCGFSVSVLLLKPCCGATVCTECVDTSSPTCVICDAEFDVDSFQKFQPGFIIKWLSNLGDASTASSDAIMLNEPDESLIDDGPIVRPAVERRKTKKFGDGHVCEYDYYSVDGKCIHCHTEHDNCNLTNSSGRCALCHRCSIKCPISESKSFYLVDRLSSMLSQKSSTLKVIVFSQFRDALNVVGDRLLKKFGTACVAEYFGRYREQELHKFIHAKECFILLLTKDGSEGLDLSFVTNIVFLEQIYDKSLQNQAVARAWRMGASGPVEVETLIASNTVEEAMYQQNLEQNMMDREALHNDDLRTAENDASRVKALLLALRLNTDYHHFGQARIPSNDKGNALFVVDKDPCSLPKASRSNQRRVQFLPMPIVHGLALSDKSILPNGIRSENILMEQIHQNA